MDDCHPTEPITEVWKPVPGFPGYEVSDQGRVKRLARKRQGKYWYVDYGEIPERILRQGLDRKGYSRVSMKLGNEYIFKNVHRLVLEAFRGPCPEGMEGCHNNGDRTDARLQNLRWDTHQNNMLDMQEHGTHHQSKKTHCPRGHRLVCPNLERSGLSRHYRKCLACARGRKACARYPELDLQQASDSYYQKIMSG